MSQRKLKLLVGGWHLLKQKMGFGNPTLGGFDTMEEALIAVNDLNRFMLTTYGIEIYVSGHLWHELEMPSYAPGILGKTTEYNSPRAIILTEWIKGRKGGCFPPIGRIVPPGFGLPLSDNGAFINPDSKARQIAHEAMVYAFGQSELVISNEAGIGWVIFWTGPDGLRWQRLIEGDDTILGHDYNPQLEEWKMVMDGVSAAVIEAKDKGFTDNSKLLIEGKAAGDPCYLDSMTDTHLEIVGVNTLNEMIGKTIAYWQGEFCHTRGAGQRFASAMKQVIGANVWDGQIHLNAGGIARVNFSRLLRRPEGVKMSKLQQYVDPDYLPGEGVEEWLKDQSDSIAVGARWAKKHNRDFEIEFDARFCRYPDTIERLKKSAIWTIDQYDLAA